MWDVPAPGDVVAVVEDVEGLELLNGGRVHDRLDVGLLATEGSAAELCGRGGIVSPVRCMWGLWRCGIWFVRGGRRTG